jgi:hypothetical protein
MLYVILQVCGQRYRKVIAAFRSPSKEQCSIVAEKLLKMIHFALIIVSPVTFNTISRSSVILKVRSFDLGYYYTTTLTTSTPALFNRKKRKTR